MDSSSRRRSSPPLMLLPEDLIIRILLLHLEDRHGMTPSTRYAGLRRVCAIFRRICDSPEVLCLLQLRSICQYVRWWPGVSWSQPSSAGPAPAAHFPSLAARLILFLRSPLRQSCPRPVPASGPNRSLPQLGSARPASRARPLTGGSHLLAPLSPVICPHTHPLSR